MARHQLILNGPRPYFAEFPYYLWGEVNYDSDGDCERPTDRNWTWLYLRNRDTGETLELSSEGDRWRIDGPDSLVARAELFLAHRCDVSTFEEGAVEEWDHASAMLRAARVAEEFEQPILAPFDTHLFWGSWKWIGWFATDFTWAGRWIMHSVVRKDPRAVSLCIRWLKHGTVSEDQTSAIRYALNCLTGARLECDGDWIEWYEGSPRSQGHKTQYPEPDFDSWLADLKAQSGVAEASRV